MQYPDSKEAAVRANQFIDAVMRDENFDWTVIWMYALIYLYDSFFFVVQASCWPVLIKEEGIM